MRILSFKGGIHPHDNKSLSANHPIKLLNPGDELIYPLSQHIGAPAKAIVAKGDHVLVGQIIANGNGMISANVASSVSGTVKTIDLRLAPTGFLLIVSLLLTITNIKVFQNTTQQMIIIIIAVCKFVNLSLTQELLV